LAEIPLRALIIESSESDYLQLEKHLRRGGYVPETLRIETADRFHEALAEKWDIVVSAYLLPRFGALEALRILNERGLDTPLIVVSDDVSERYVHSALAAGAADFITRHEHIRLNTAISRELRAAAARRERKHLEEQVRHTQRLEAVGRLAGGVAHDFNNLLTIISGYAELLLLDDCLPTRQRSAAEEIRRAAQRGGSLTHRLLAFSRRQPMTARILHMNDLLVNLERMLRPVIGEDIAIVTIPGATNDTVLADAAQLEQVIINIVVNAKDAMPSGGKLTIEAGNTVIDAEQAAAMLAIKPGPHVVVTITDTGTGMDQETRCHVFEPFFTTKAPGKGTGLGLATAYGIMRQSGGAIAVESELGCGTTLTLHLPLATAQAESEPAADLPGRSASGCETILVVEDEPRVRRLIRDVLTNKGYDVVTHNRGESAIRFAEAYDGPIHLAILDVVMPEMSGPEVGKQIVGIRPETRLLYMSGYTDEAIIDHGVLDSGAAFLQKPFLPAVLANKVREVIDCALAAHV
jgi:signal transduction histidine kinase